MPAKYQFVGLHADSLDDGRPVAPGDFVTLSDEDALLEYNAGMLADGRLVPTGEKSQQIAATAERESQREQDKENETQEGGS